MLKLTLVMFLLTVFTQGCDKNSNQAHDDKKLETLNKVEKHAPKWLFINKVDDFTDKKIIYAKYDDGEHKLQISREEHNVWIFITRYKTGTFEPDGIVEMRVDKNEANIENPKMLKVYEESTHKKFYQWEPSTIGMSIWHGDENEGKNCGFISQIINGKVLKIRYQTSPLEREAFTVNLEGAKSAIINALELKKCGYVN